MIAVSKDMSELDMNGGSLPKNSKKAKTEVKVQVLIKK
jgi:hypothetical protein